MQVILLERIGRLGQMGDVVTVKDGFARNFLLSQGKALRATKANRERFERDRTQREEWRAQLVRGDSLGRGNRHGARADDDIALRLGRELPGDLVAGSGVA